MYVVYVSHPYGGKGTNRVLCDAAIKMLASQLPEVTFVSALHAIRRPYNALIYKDGLKLCLELEQACDAVLMTGDWGGSVGGQTELAFAYKLGIPVSQSIEELKEGVDYIPLEPDARKENFYKEFDAHIAAAKEAVRKWNKKERKNENNVAGVDKSREKK